MTINYFFIVGSILPGNNTHRDAVFFENGEKIAVQFLLAHRPLPVSIRTMRDQVSILKPLVNINDLECIKIHCIKKKHS